METSFFDFTGATALIVGGASGLGRPMAEALAAHGAAILVTELAEADALEVANDIAAQTRARCHAAAMDLRSEASVRALGAEVDRLFEGRLNIAINCAGINIRNPIDDVSIEEWISVQRVNTTGAFLLAREMHPRLTRGGWGRLIHIASIFGSRSFRHRTSYAASKGALLQLTRTLAIEWADDQVTVNAISPGPFVTEMTRRLRSNPEAHRRFCENIPLGRLGEPREIVTACLFLASRDSSYVTGADIAVDGGWTAT